MHAYVKLVNCTCISFGRRDSRAKLIIVAAHHVRLLGSRFCYVVQESVSQASRYKGFVAWRKARLHTHCYFAQVEDIHHDIQDDQPYNPYTEARLLVGHTDSVNQIAKIDEKRPVFVTGF